MPEKEGTYKSPWLKLWSLRSSPWHQWRLGLLTALVFVCMVVVWSIDGFTVKSCILSWRFQEGYKIMNITLTNLSQTPQILSHNLQNPTFNITQVPDDLNKNEEKTTQFASSTSANSMFLRNVKQNQTHSLKWISAEMEANFTTNLLARLNAPEGKPCKNSPTVEVAIPGLDGKGSVELAAGEIYEFVFQALDTSGNARCLGGDYFETDLSGESWKSRPPVKDFGNGSYSFALQVHPDFVGDYNLSLILLFRHFEGLKLSTDQFAYVKELRHVGIRFYKTNALLPELQICQKSDFSTDVWSGRWTRHGRNDSCQISYDGRFRCLPPEFPCQNPWCTGALGVLESNGWVYSAHCSFVLFTADSAWNCLKNRWIFFWGDSNHQDTIRNLLNFVLDQPEIRYLPRRFDLNYSNPKDPSQTVRITNIFNGHWNESDNLLGLESLKNAGFKDLLKKYFSEDTAPDTVIMNSGLHDGFHWSSVNSFTEGAEYAASFWKEVMESVKLRGLGMPQILYRTTIATGGYARSLAANPSKMEAFNGILLEKLRQVGLVSGVIDNFDMTFPWHFDNRCNEGQHYGRAPVKAIWADGKIGHQYFVDLMLGHVLLNALCVR
ncbi:hypothetical protein SLA2020_211810 [Shorea laevis]